MKQNLKQKSQKTAKTLTNLTAKRDRKMNL